MTRSAAGLRWILTVLVVVTAACGDGTDAGSADPITVRWGTGMLSQTDGGPVFACVPSGDAEVPDCSHPLRAVGLDDLDGFATSTPGESADEIQVLHVTLVGTITEGTIEVSEVWERFEDTRETHRCAGEAPGVDTEGTYRALQGIADEIGMFAGGAEPEELDLILRLPHPDAIEAVCRLGYAATVQTLAIRVPDAAD
ncbi:MAG: hypothetical protein AAGA90_16870 [Actinomycetota bacterium]